MVKVARTMMRLLTPLKHNEVASVLIAELIKTVPATANRALGWVRFRLGRLLPVVCSSGHLRRSLGQCFPMSTP